MYRVLLPIDTNEDRAKAQAAYVRNLPNSDETVEALLLHVFTEGEGTDEASSEVAGRKDATRVGAVRRAREQLEEAGIEVSIIDESGDPAKQIIAEADANDVQAIVLGSKKRSPAGKAVFGSVAQAVILDSTRPVVVTDHGD